MKLPSLLLLFITISVNAWSTSYADEPDIKLGPLLHFEGQDLHHSTWDVSALYLLPSASVHPELTAFADGNSFTVAGRVLGSKYGYDFVRYDVAVRQQNQSRFVDYVLATEQESHRFVVPAIGQPHNILFHSCNGYQKEEDRKSVGGIEPMWHVINQAHQKMPYHLQIGGGDQLYADGLVNKGGKHSKEPHQGHTYGVFALKSLKNWISDARNHGIAQFTEEMRADVDKFYFDHYVNHYNSPEFKYTMASIPSLVQPDDHDFFDGCGSYPSYLQQGNVMKGIRSIGMWYAFTIQHQLVADEYVATSDHEARPYHYIYVVDDGLTAILGVDTRTERTDVQVVSEQSWRNIFESLTALDSRVEHLFVVLGIPIVYAPSKALDETYKMVEATPLLGTVLPHMPVANLIFEKNAFKLFELADDLRDGWCHPDHLNERNMLIDNLQTFAREKKIRTSIISGDVHLGGVGLIFRKGLGVWDDDTIANLISTPVGNVTPGPIAAKTIGMQACAKQDVGCDSQMCLTRMLNPKGRESKHALHAHRNFLSLKRTAEGDFDAVWSMERSCREKPHKLYHFTVPRINQ